MINYSIVMRSVNANLLEINRRQKRLDLFDADLKSASSENLCFNRLEFFVLYIRTLATCFFARCCKYFIVCNLPYIYYKYILLVSEFNSTFAVEFMINDKTKIYNWKFS